MKEPIKIFRYNLSTEKTYRERQKDEENAALADMYSTALKSGKVVGFISDDAPGVIEARKALGQIS
ncbi:hypothetical protein [Citrobacter amalonaticus]|uniref:hypothetical protein n=1 Tax=Citrobacter amalonaticus TaxID=35703 RepID=UPI000F665C08|nr:hypothetical protein [Citrobacter amalonaticus]RSC60591.1 hypothetical protein EGW07_24505 [Citrobacter amalonaticus]